ncbi:MAG TPA: hypothetical protein VGP47_10160 [Parachlamydiaceae bacterium]|nr:hypothetical protein [Parachlamydiaceae bacterium]
MEYIGYAYDTIFPTPYMVPLEFDELESTFLENISSRISIFKSQNLQKIDLFCLRTSESMKRDFKEYASKKYADKNYSPEALDLESIISSIWHKTKNNVQTQLLQANVHEEIYDEINWQLKADQCLKECNIEAHTAIYFTPRQIKVLMGESALERHFCRIQ